MLKNKIANPYLRGLVEWLLAIGLALLFLFVMRNYTFRMAHVTGSSMEPTLYDGDMVVLNRAGWLISGPRIGDIVAFPYRLDPSENYIKRIIAIGGDTVDLYDGAFYVNDLRLDDDFSHERVIRPGDENFPLTVPDGTIFVLGDNRNNSKDSRFTAVGSVPYTDVVGRVSVRVWPFGSLGRP
ncbi:MAG: signal peptidase I [Defluviitaleaceae bacterium]|nr:signal peptidase I [Defluviitaleaceae bacterium]MCL2274665.1 signal peptidase I [Defluviitaleaceae bacterium]MCL2275774.1 signal peptidase I [Defluviitaleaceae bacterium]